MRKYPPFLKRPLGVAALVVVVLFGIPLTSMSSDRDIISASAAMGGVGGYLGGLTIGRHYYRKGTGPSFRRFATENGGAIAGLYLGATLAREGTGAFDVKLHKTVLGACIGVLAMAPLEFIVAGTFGESKTSMVLSTFVLIGGAFAGARAGTNNLAVTGPVIRF